MKEWVDVINEKGEVIEKALRSEIHKRKLLHKGIRVFIFNSKGQLFVQKRSDKKDVYPGWHEGSLSGHVMSGENCEEAAQRELKEELGITAIPKKLFEYERFDNKESAIFTLFIIEEYDKPITVDNEEVSSGEFMDLDEIQEEIKGNKKRFTPGFVKALELYLKQG